MFKAKTLLWTELCLPQNHVLIPYLPKVMVLEMDTIWDIILFIWSHEGEALMMYLVPL